MEWRQYPSASIMAADGSCMGPVKISYSPGGAYLNDATSPLMLLNAHGNDVQYMEILYRIHYCHLLRCISWTPWESTGYQWRGSFIFSLTYAWTNGWANSRDAGDLRSRHAHCKVTVMFLLSRRKCYVSSCQDSHHLSGKRASPRWSRQWSLPSANT